MPSRKPNADLPDRQRRDPNARSITFRFPLAIYSELVKRAEDEHRSMNAVCCLLLEEALAAREEREQKQQQELTELRRLARLAKTAEREAAAS